MLVVRSVAVREIEDHLVKLGGGNHSDNLVQIKRYPRHYLLRLTEADFMSLIFLQTAALRRIAPVGHDRRLQAVAERVRLLSPDAMNLGSNWNLGAMLSRFEHVSIRAKHLCLSSLLVRDARGEENRWSPDGWYLQDGSHRALAYCVKIVSQELPYQPQLAFCATLRRFDVD